MKNCPVHRDGRMEGISMRSKIVCSVLGILFVGSSLLLAQEKGQEHEAEESTSEEAAPEGGEEPSAPVVTAPAILVRERRKDSTWVVRSTGQRPAPEAVDLVREVPGGAVNDNGPVSSQIQLRGMFGPRIPVRIEGMPIEPVGPNWMDPPLQELPTVLLGSLEVSRGIASVDRGAETIGGFVTAHTVGHHFAKETPFLFEGSTNLAFRGIDRGLTAGTELSGASRHHRIELQGSLDRGDSISFPGGEIPASSHERYTYGATYQGRFKEHGFSLRFLRNDTKASGNPVLPMDIRFVKTNRVAGEYHHGTRGKDLFLEARVSAMSGDHEMDNFSVRPSPEDPMAYRLADVSAKTLDFDLSTAIPFARENEAKFGLDGRFENHDMRILNPNSEAFFVDAFNDVSRDRFSLFGVLRGSLHPRWRGELGGRYTRVAMDAGQVDISEMLPPPAHALKDAFNAAERNQVANMFDLVAKLEFLVLRNQQIRFDRGDLALRLEGGRKGRAPSYLERYAWIPLEVTAGLADGNNYVGTIELDPEISNEAAFGLLWRGERSLLSSRIFFRKVDGYITGVPFDETPGQIDSEAEMVSNVNGDPTPLRWSNVDALFQGIDLSVGISPLPHWFVQGILNYVRGKRQDIDDDLYRISPLNGRSRISYRRSAFSISAEGVFVAPQHAVSATNNESPSSGYALGNLFFQVYWKNALSLGAGVENITNQRYHDHLSGMNRVASPDLQAGEPLPGAGRNFFITLQASW